MKWSAPNWRSKRLNSPAAFTLVEMLVSVALLVFVISLTALMIGGATSATQVSEKEMDASTQARIFLSRFGADLNSLVKDGGFTALYYGNASGNSAIGFVCQSRPRDNAATSDARGVTVGYKIRSTADAVSGLSYPMIARGDGRLTYSAQSLNGTDRYDWNPIDIFPRTGSDLVNASPGDTSFLDWETIGEGVLLFHLSFLLNDGTTVQTPPAYNNFLSGAVTVNNCTPIAFCAADSADANKRYVVAIMAGVAVLDTTTRNLAFQTDPTFAADFATALGSPPDGNTPLSVWNANLPNLAAPTFIKPVRANVRFYERMFSIN